MVITTENGSHQQPDQRLAAVLVAAGVGSRMGIDSNKVFLTLDGEPILSRAIRPFLSLPGMELIVVVTRPEEREECIEVLNSSGVPIPPGQDREPRLPEVIFAAGGSTRQQSVANGVAVLAKREFPVSGVVLIHDGARPYVTGDLLSRVARAVTETGAAVAAVPAIDTVKKIDGDGFVTATLNRGELWYAQTPQAATFGRLQKALSNAEEKDIVATDTSSLLELMGNQVKIVKGDYQNRKITTQEDLGGQHAKSQGTRDDSLRVGTGYDIHRMAPDRRLVLAGVEIPHSKGPVGHSDADVLIHAIIDALLGAIAAGDIGSHFPDTAQELKGIDSALLLEKTMVLLRAKGAGVVNIDTTVVCQTPKLQPHIPRIKLALGHMMEIDPSAISVKAKTNEGLGSLGSGDAIAAHAVALVTLGR